MIGEYLNIVLMCAMLTILFFRRLALARSMFPF